MRQGIHGADVKACGALRRGRDRRADGGRTRNLVDEEIEQCIERGKNGWSNKKSNTGLRMEKEEIG
jgi:hypothetical protein